MGSCASLHQSRVTTPEIKWCCWSGLELDGCRLAIGFDDSDEVSRAQACTPHERSIDIWNGCDFSSIRRFNRAAVKDGNGSRRPVEKLGEHRANVAMNITNFSGRWCQACSYGPDRLISNNRLLGRGVGRQRPRNLPGDYVQGSSFFPLCQALADADNG